MPPTTDRPNLLLSIADDQRGTALGCAGVEAVHTPAMDALAARGTRFDRAWHAGSMVPAVCMPSRAMLLSGRSPFELPADMMFGDLTAPDAGPESAVTLPELLREAGYHTHLVGKWHNGDAALRRGFVAGTCVFNGGMCDPFDVPNVSFDGSGEEGTYAKGVHAVELFADAAERVIAAHRRGDFGDKPLFLMVAWTSPHDPRRTHRQFHDRYDPAEIALPPNAWPRHPFDLGDGACRDELLSPLPRDPGEMRRQIADYHAMVTHLDAGLARVLEAMGPEALTAHTADHGLAVGQHGLLGKQNLYEHSTRVPLIVAGPGVAPGRVDTTPCYQHELMPTFCEAAGVTPPDGVTFESLLPRLRGVSTDTPKWVGTRYRDLQRAVSNGRHKFIRHLAPAPDAPAEQAFDLDTDPWETEDLLAPGATPPPWIADARDALATWQQQFHDPHA